MSHAQRKSKSHLCPYICLVFQMLHVSWGSCNGLFLNSSWCLRWWILRCLFRLFGCIRPMHCYRWSYDQNSNIFCLNGGWPWLDFTQTIDFCVVCLFCLFTSPGHLFEVWAASVSVCHYGASTLLFAVPWTSSPSPPTFSRFSWMGSFDLRRHCFKK